MPNRKYWLFKSEPTVYSFQDLMGEEDRVAEWDGVRNYQARNFMRDDMKVGDGIPFLPYGRGDLGGRYWQDCPRGLPRPHRLGPQGQALRPQEQSRQPHMVHGGYTGRGRATRPVPLKEIKENPALQNMTLVKASRLSVQPVGEREFEEIVALGGDGT